MRALESHQNNLWIFTEVNLNTYPKSRAGSFLLYTSGERRGALASSPPGSAGWGSTVSSSFPDHSKSQLTNVSQSGRNLYYDYPAEEEHRNGSERWGGGSYVLAAAHAEGLDDVERRVARVLAARRLRRGAEVQHHAPLLAGARHGVWSGENHGRPEQWRTGGGASWSGEQGGDHRDERQWKVRGAEGVSGGGGVSTQREPSGNKWTQRWAGWVIVKREDRNMGRKCSIDWGYYLFLGSIA